MGKRVGYKDLFDENLDNQIKALSQEIQGLSDSINQLVQQSASVKGSTKKTGDGYRENAKAIEELNNVQRALIEKEKQLKATEDQIVKATAKRIAIDSKKAKQLAANEQLLKNQRDALKLQVQLEKAQAGSIEELELQIKKLVAERKKLGEAQGKNSEQFKELTAQIRERKQELKELSSLEMTEANSIKALKDETKKLKQAQENLDTTTKEGRAEYERLGKEIAANQSVLKAYREEQRKLAKDQDIVANSIEALQQENNQLIKGKGAFWLCRSGRSGGKGALSLCRSGRSGNGSRGCRGCRSRHSGGCRGCRCRAYKARQCVDSKCKVSEKCI